MRRPLILHISGVLPYTPHYSALLRITPHYSALLRITLHYSALLSSTPLSNAERLLRLYGETHIKKSSCIAESRVTHIDLYIILSHICIFICHTSKNTSRTATSPHDKELRYMSESCHRYKYNVTHINITPHISILCHTYEYKIYMDVCEVPHSRVCVCVCVCVSTHIWGASVTMELFMWGYPHQKSSCIYTSYVTYVHIMSYM